MRRLLCLPLLLVMLGADRARKEALIPAPKKGDTLYLAPRDSSVRLPKLLVSEPNKEDWEEFRNVKDAASFQKSSEAGSIRLMDVGAKLQVVSFTTDAKLGNSAPVEVKVLEGPEKGHRYWVPLRSTSATRSTAAAAGVNPARGRASTPAERQAAAADYAGQWDKAVDDANAIYGRDPKPGVHQAIMTRVLGKYPGMTEAELKVAVSEHYKAEEERQTRLAASRSAAQNQAMLAQQQAVLQRNQAMLQQQQMQNLQRRQQLLQQESFTEGLLQYQLMQNR